MAVTLVRIHRQCSWHTTFKAQLSAQQQCKLEWKPETRRAAAVACLESQCLFLRISMMIRLKISA